MKSGIYKILNTVNSHTYLGSSKNLNKRQKEHFRYLMNNKHINRHLQNAFNLYGQNSFLFIVLEYCEENELLNREQFWLDNYRLRGEILYNICLFAGNSLGRKHSDATKLHFSKIRKGKKLSSKHIQKIKDALKGRVAWNKGIPHTEAQKKKQSETSKRLGIRPPNRMMKE